MEDTLKNRELFFAQYWGQKIAYRHNQKSRIIKYVKNLVLGTYAVNEKVLTEKGWFLELTPVISVSDEDAVEVSRIMGLYDQYAIIGRIFCTREFDNSNDMKETMLYNMHCEAVEYMRSKGYAMPWRGVTVKKQIEYGWIKLKTV